MTGPSICSPSCASTSRWKATTRKLTANLALFLLHYEGEKPFYETLSASTAAGIADSRTRNLSVGLENIEIPSQATETLPANGLRVYFMMVPTTLPAGELTATVVCRNGTRYVKTQTLSSEVCPPLLFAETPKKLSSPALHPAGREFLFGDKTI